MKNNLFLTTVAGFGLVTVLALSGCETAKSTISVGKVDTAVLLQDDPDYQNLSLDYTKEQVSIKREFTEKLKATNKDKAKVDQLRKEYLTTQQSFNEKWQNKTEDFLKARHASIQDVASEIAKRKNIDLIIIDSEQYPTVEYGGVDMTQDLALALSNDAKPSASPSPSGDKEG